MRTQRSEADEALVDAMRSNFGRLCVRTLRATCHPRVEEYVQEAEHQDGAGFWDQFAGELSAMWEDFRLYIQHS